MLRLEKSQNVTESHRTLDNVNRVTEGRTTLTLNQERISKLKEKILNLPKGQNIAGPLFMYDAPSSFVMDNYVLMIGLFWN